MYFLPCFVNKEKVAHVSKSVYIRVIYDHDFNFSVILPSAISIDQYGTF